MNPKNWRILTADFWTDVQHLSYERLEELCAAYRKKPENRFFPTSGQLLAADPDPAPRPPPSQRFVAPADETPTPTQCDAMHQLAEQLRTDIAKQRAEREDHPPLPHVVAHVMTREEEIARVPKLLENLNKRLQAKAHGDQLGKDLCA